MKKYLLGIDQGTTGTTALLFDVSGNVKGRGYQSFKQYYPKPGWVEHHPEEIWKSVVLAVKASLRLAKANSRQIAGIGITNQRETSVVWDRVSGKSPYPAIVWQCRRTTDLIEKLKKRKGLADRVRRLTGLPLDPYFSASKIQWLLDHVSGLRKKATAGRVCFGTIDTFLLWRLTGGQSHSTDFTNASRTLLFDIKKKRWSPELLKLFNVPKSVLPEVKASNSSFGMTKGLSFLPDGVPIAAMLGDQQSALFGQGCTRAGEAKNTYGTGSFFMVQLGQKPIFSKSGLLTTLAVDNKGNPTYALEGSVFIAGAAIQWMRDEVKWIKNAQTTEAIAARFRRKNPEPHVYMVPAFVGLGAPFWNPEARGAFFGLTRGTTQDEMITATLESMAYQLADLIQVFKNDLKGKLKVLKVDGGACQNNYLMQFQADLLGLPVVRPGMVETTALGSAKLAGLSLNFWKSAKCFERGEFTYFNPKLPKKRRETRMKGWQDSVRRVL